MKDIFIDTNIVKNFNNPLDPEYKKLITWLQHTKGPTIPKEEQAHLVISQKLLNEYNRSCGTQLGATNILILIALLQREGRLNNINQKLVDDFRQRHFTARIESKLQCNNEDRKLIPVVLLSHRKMALTLDQNFSKDLFAFRGYTPTVASRPEKLPYQ